MPDLNGTILGRFLADVSKTRALVIGDLMLDEYVWGGVDRISPEAPVQVVNVREKELRLGGAGNVINNLLTLNCKVEVASVVGDDDDGRFLLKRLTDRGVACKGVSIETGRTTSRKTRVLASNQQVVRIDQESVGGISEDGETGLLKYVRDVLPEIDVVFLSDYQKGVLSNRVLQEIICIGRKSGVPVLIDPKGEDFSKYCGATVLTPNRKETCLATGKDVSDETSISDAGMLLLEELKLDALVLTRSEEGMSVFTDEDVFHLPTEAREVYDVSGAGDTVLTLFGLGLAQKLPLRSIAELANLAAGVVVGKVGTSTVTPDEMLSAFSIQHRGDATKVVSIELLNCLIKDVRKKDQKVIFTNGCFDLLHAGHVKYLQAARQLGDLLILGLNSDASVQRLKGPKRPLISQEERAHILAALDCVDYVVVFDEDTPLELIAAIKPDILVKGGDYSLSGVVGRDLVEGYGGRVELISFVDGKSTTNIINKILESYQD